MKSDNANLNYLNLIAYSLSTSELELSDRTRLLAKRKYEEQVSKFFEDKSNSLEYGVIVRFSETQSEIANIKFENRNCILSYSFEWFNNNVEYPVILIYNFINVFEFVDYQIRFTLVHKFNNMGIIERFMGISGKNEYIKGIEFNQLNSATLLQMKYYYDLLKSKDIQMEKVFKWFFENYINSEFLVNGFYYNSSTDESSFLEKSRNINSEIDSILKQFKIWCEEKHIDRDLIEISSNHIIYENIPSMIENKYIYACSDEFKRFCYLICSDQSPVHFISEEFKESKFYDLILNNNLKITDFHEYQWDEIEWMKKKSYLYENKEGYLKVDKNLCLIAYELFFNDVLSYHHLTKNVQNEVNDLLKKRDLKSESYLFSRPESDYLNYLLNRSKFSNGLDLRNKYIHGTQTLDKLIHERDYYQMLIVLILCIIKINDEFCLEYKILNEKTKL